MAVRSLWKMACLSCSSSRQRGQQVYARLGGDITLAVSWGRESIGEVSPGPTQNKQVSNLVASKAISGTSGDKRQPPPHAESAGQEMARVNKIFVCCESVSRQSKRANEPGGGEGRGPGCIGT